MARLQRVRRLLTLVIGSAGLAVFTRIRPHRWVPPALSLRVLRWYFEPGSAVIAEAIRAQVPPGGRTVLPDRSYDPGAGRDGLFDLVLPEDAGPGNGTGPPALVVWVHGGGWYYGSKADALPYLELLARHGFAGAALNVPRLPEQRHPAAPRAVAIALGHLVSHAADYGIDAGRIVLAGDSAGAQVAASVALACVSPGYATRLGIDPPLPAGTLRGTALFSGTFDAEALLDAGRAFTAILASSMWAQAGTRDWAGSETADLITVRPHLVAGFPPTFLRAGRADPLTAAGTVPFAAELERLGVSLDVAVLGDETDPGAHNLQFRLGTAHGQQVATDLIAFLGTVTARSAPAGASNSH